jgi:hypothetical protein
MSKRQEKIERRKKERDAFMAARRTMQIAQWENNLEIGERIYEENKDKLSPEEVQILDGHIKENRELLVKLKDELNSFTQA